MSPTPSSKQPVPPIQQPKSSSTPSASISWNPVPSNFLNTNKRSAVSELALSQSPRKVPRLAALEDENEDNIGFGEVPEVSYGE